MLIEILGHPTMQRNHGQFKFFEVIQLSQINRWRFCPFSEFWYVSWFF